MMYLPLIIPLILIIGIILHRWRMGIVLMFVWLIAEDMVRRFIPGQPPAVVAKELAEYKKVAVMELMSHNILK